MEAEVAYFSDDIEGAREAFKHALALDSEVRLLFHCYVQGVQCNCEDYDAQIVFFFSFHCIVVIVTVTTRALYFLYPSFTH